MTTIFSKEHQKFVSDDRDILEFKIQFEAGFERVLLGLQEQLEDDSKKHKEEREAEVNHKAEKLQRALKQKTEQNKQSEEILKKIEEFLSHYQSHQNDLNQTLEDIERIVHGDKKQ